MRQALCAVPLFLSISARAGLPPPSELERIMQCQQDGLSIDMLSAPGAPEELPECVAACDESADAVAPFCVATNAAGGGSRQIRMRIFERCRLSECDTSLDSLLRIRMVGVRIAHLLSIPFWDVKAYYLSWDVATWPPPTLTPSLDKFFISRRDDSDFASAGGTGAAGGRRLDSDIEGGSNSAGGATDNTADLSHGTVNVTSVEGRRLQTESEPWRLTHMAFRIDSSRVVADQSTDLFNSTFMSEFLGTPVDVLDTQVMNNFFAQQFDESDYRAVFQFSGYGVNEDPFACATGCFEFDETANPMGAHRCDNACHCLGARYCSGFGYCIGDEGQCASRTSLTTTSQTSTTSTSRFLPPTTTTTTTTPIPTTSTSIQFFMAQGETLAFSMKVENLDIDALEEDQSLLEDVKDSVRTAVAAESGEEVTPDHVNVELKRDETDAANAAVDVTITPPVGLPAASVQSTLISAIESGGLSAEVADEVGKVPEIEKATGGLPIAVAQTSAPEVIAAGGGGNATTSNSRPGPAEEDSRLKEGNFMKNLSDALGIYGVLAAIAMGGLCVMIVLTAIMLRYLRRHTIAEGFGDNAADRQGTRLRAHAWASEEKSRASSGPARGAEPAGWPGAPPPQMSNSRGFAAGPGSPSDSKGFGAGGPFAGYEKPSTAQSERAAKAKSWAASDSRKSDDVRGPGTPRGSKGPPEMPAGSKEKPPERSSPSFATRASAKDLDASFRTGAWAGAFAKDASSADPASPTSPTSPASPISPNEGTSPPSGNARERPRDRARSGSVPASGSAATKPTARDTPTAGHARSSKSEGPREAGVASEKSNIYSNSTAPPASDSVPAPPPSRTSATLRPNKAGAEQPTDSKQGTSSQPAGAHQSSSSQSTSNQSSSHQSSAHQSSSHQSSSQQSSSHTEKPSPADANASRRAQRSQTMPESGRQSNESQRQSGSCGGGRSSSSQHASKPSKSSNDNGGGTSPCSEDPCSPSALARELTRIKQSQSTEERKKYYKNMCIKWHPDKNIGQEDLATPMFQVLQEKKDWFLREERDKG